MSASYPSRARHETDTLPFKNRHKPRTTRAPRLVMPAETANEATRLTWNQLDDEPEAVSADLRVLLGIKK